MGLFQSFNINASGMTAQRIRMDVISENVANVNTTRGVDGKPYRRKVVTFTERALTPFDKVLDKARLTKDGSANFSGNGVKVSSISEDMTEVFIKYHPSHPDADDNGYVSYPNVNIVEEMTNLIDTSRAYEANATAFEASKGLATKGLEIGRW